MIKRLLLVLLASVVSAAAQSTPAGTKAADATAPTTAPASKVKASEDEVDNSVVITPFRSLTPPEAKTSRTFQLSKLNKPGFTETTKELQRLYSAFATQRIVDGSPAGSSKAIGYLTPVNYAIVQDLGDNRFLAKAAWPASGPNEALAAGVDTMAILLLEKPAKVGDTGKITGMHVGTVALLFTATYPPLSGKRLTIRRDAFVECVTLEESAAGLRKFVEAINAGAEMSTTTNEQITCKKCGGLGFIREAQKGQLVDKRIPCADCASSGKVIISIETKFAP
ncbi:MAG: hypothetical protein ORN22_00315 [Opitutales bacterium]|nr:hypothetical protein [Opitutales bacterium]